MTITTSVAARNQVFVERLVNTVLVRRPRLGYNEWLWAGMREPAVPLPMAA
jgi:hypothetical protein